VSTRTTNRDADETLPTRQSLLVRLRNWDDQESWRNFFNIYWKLIYHTARKAGLQDVEAQEVVQETVIIVAKKIKTFRYNPETDSFKGWLLYITRKSIAGQYRKRQGSGRENGRGGTAGRTPENIYHPELVENELEKLWDREWEQNLMDAAIRNVKELVSPKQFQIFNFYVLKGWSVNEVAKTLEVGRPTIYLAKHRVSVLIRKELKRFHKQKM
jgi:RNA polymerase sigma factor (sigma-70 family)